jgi:beta-lactam-binding protein with PASTA domain
VAIIAVVDSPRRKGYYGGLVAAPLFKDVGEATLRYLGIPPTTGAGPTVLAWRDGRDRAVTPIAVHPASHEQAAAAVALAVAEGVVPDLRGMSAREAVRALGRLGLDARLTGSGVVARQSLAPGSPAVPGGACALTLERDPVPDTTVQP